MLKDFFSDESGQGMVEYIIIVALIAAAVVAAFKLFGKQIKGLFGGASDKIKEETSDFAN